MSGASSLVQASVESEPETATGPEATPRARPCHVKSASISAGSGSAAGQSALPPSGAAQDDRSRCDHYWWGGSMRISGDFGLLCLK